MKWTAIIAALFVAAVAAGPLPEALPEAEAQSYWCGDCKNG